MITEKETREKLDGILKDERFWYEPANVFSNAPLALIQTELSAEFRTLCFVLELRPNEVKEDYKILNKK